MEGSVESATTTPSNVWGSPTVSRPWGAVNTNPASPSLKDVMSEELATQLQEEEDNAFSVSVSESPVTEDVPEQIENDLLLAQMLQHEFDKEHDLVLSKKEKKWNGASNVTVSYENYRVVHPALRPDVDDEDDDDDGWDGEIDAGFAGPSFGRGGVCGKGKNMISKHDSGLSGKLNVQRAESNLPASMPVGDMGQIKDLKLSNKVYNKLKTHAVSQGRYSTKVHEKKDHATSDQVVDSKTRLIMYKLVNGGTLDVVNGVISAGKESVVYHGVGGKDAECEVPAEVAIKVFKTSLASFKNRCAYMKGDVRFFKDHFKKQNPRKIMKLWSEKEEINLRSMTRHGIPCPKAVVLKKHVLVMEFIGENQVAAPKLAEAKLSPSDAKIAFDQCVENMKKLYTKSMLVHADLSEYNMLWYKGKVYFIDVAQAVDHMHPLAKEFLLRDCDNVTRFFKQQGVSDVMSPYELFNSITGLNFVGEGEEFKAQFEEYDKSKDLLQLEMNKTSAYPFDYFYERAQKERQNLAEDDDDDFEDDDDLEDDEEEIEDDDVDEEEAHSK